MDNVFNAAQDVAEHLDSLLSPFEWLNGITVTSNPLGPRAVLVFIDPSKLLDQAKREGKIPNAINGVPIYLKHKEMPHAL